MYDTFEGFPPQKNRVFGLVSMTPCIRWVVGVATNRVPRGPQLQAAIAKLNGLNTDLKRIEEMKQTWIFHNKASQICWIWVGPSIWKLGASKN